MIRLQSIECQGEQKKSGISKDNKSQLKPGLASESLYDPPRGDNDGKAHDEPKSQSHHAHLENEAAEAAFHSHGRRLGMEDTCDILSTKRQCANAISVRPALVTESAEEIPNRVIPCAVLEFAGAAAGRERFCVKRHSRQERLWVRGKQDYDSKPHTESGALHVPQDTHHFALAPGRAPDKSGAADEGRSDAPENDSAGSTERNGRGREPESQHR